MPPRDSVRVRAEARLTGERPAGDAIDGAIGDPVGATPGDASALSKSDVGHGSPIRPRGPVGIVTAFARSVWRHLTSMRTALVLLFLLALASLPGALLPQWDLNQSKTAQYILDHPVLGRALDKLGFFDVFSSPWYSAIYLLLFVSLVGCLTPRTVELVRQWRAKPVATPRNLARLPHHEVVTAAGTPAQVAERIRVALRHKGFGGWRVAVRDESGGTGGSVTVSAERGYLREVGNLAFHFAVLGLLIAVALGSLFGFKGSSIVVAGDGFCSVSPISYDNFSPGRLVDGTDMAPFCVDVTDFHADYTDIGQAISFRADLQVQSGADVGTNRWHSVELQPNDPLRVAGQRLYLLGHGYAPTFTVRYPDGQVRNYQAPFPAEDSMFTSQGVVKITDPPGYSGTAINKHQLAIVGIFAPSAVVNAGVLTSGYPALLAPAVAVEVYQGELGIDNGAPQSVFAIDNDQVSKGLLVSQGRKNLTKGQSMTLADGTVITFTGAKDYVTLQTSYDPAQGLALIFAILLVAGLLASLTIKRRRVWYRIAPAREDGGDGGRTLSQDGAPRCTVAVGGLARTDQAGYGAEFDSLVALAGRRVVGTQDVQDAKERMT